MAAISDKLYIQLRIDNQIYPVNVERSEEEYYREAERNINDRLNIYKAKFPNLAHEQYLYMVMLDLSLRLVKSERRNDTEPYRQVMGKLTEEIENTLRGERS